LKVCITSRPMAGSPESSSKPARQARATAGGIKSAPEHEQSHVRGEGIGRSSERLDFREAALRRRVGRVDYGDGVLSCRQQLSKRGAL
jgi:hypothetical protein